MKLLCLLLVIGSLHFVGVAWAEDDWRKEFDAVCCQTDNAMSMSIEQLRDSVKRCEKIKPAIEGLEPSPRKVFLKRWQLCRDLFKYVLDSKEAAAKDGK
jgi:hypothetical protein